MSFFSALLDRKQGTGFIFWGLVTLRAVFNYSLPLMDKTEARYAEIARIMAETGNWVVPQIDYTIPFWAKPPLSTWASALSISLFGTHEFFVRLPYLLLAIVMGLFISRYKKNQAYYLPGVLLLCLTEFYLHAGVVSTDLFLSFSLALMMLSFWESIHKVGKTAWGYLFFIGLGLGLLAKGPIIVLLSIPPIGLWCLISQNIKKAFQTAPWLLGIGIAAFMSLPWYLLADWKSPGFIDYFIVGEHFERFFNSDWSGDKYGFPKQQPLGIIWLFFLAAILPWSFLLINLLIKKWGKIKKDTWALFLLLWMLWTPFFFTISKSLIHPYVLPSMIPLCLFIITFWDEVKNKKTYLGIGIGIPIVLFIILISGSAKPLYENNTDKYLIESIDTELPLYALKQKTYSSQFYSKGKIEIINQQTLEKYIFKRDTFNILISHHYWKNLPEELKSVLKSCSKHKKTGLYNFSK